MNSSSPTKLTAGAFARAKAFIGGAQPLDRALFAFHFENGSPMAVGATLQLFQNTDGGFFGLEADIGFSASTALSTCRALHIFRDIAAPADHPLVDRALDYLITSYDPALEVWPIIPPHDNSQPHAPWWDYSEKFTENWHRFQDNPGPDVLACLCAFPSPKTDALRRQVGRVTLSRLSAAGEEMEMHGLICYLRLYRAPNLPGELKVELERVLPKWIDQGVERDPAKWTGYGLRPLDVAPLAVSPWRQLLARDIENNLDFLIQSQAPDGFWHPHWNWGGSFPEAWPAAKLKWQAVLTLDALRSLSSYGRI